MLKNLIIISAGDFGREVYAWAKQATDHGKKWRIKGFLDSRPDILKAYQYDAPILAPPEDYLPKPDDLFVCAIGNPVEAVHYCELVLNHGGKFTNIIHPTVVFGENVKLGTGVILCPHVTVSCDTIIGNYVMINLHVSVGHNVALCDFCHVSPNASLGGHAVLKKGVYVGSNAVILPSAIVEEYAVVGAGSVVLKKVNAHQTVFGIPAKPILVPKTEDNQKSSL